MLAAMPGGFIVALLAGLLGFADPSPRSAVGGGPLTDSIGAYLSRLEVYGFSGAVLVARDGHVVLQDGYGLANDSMALPVDADTPFLLGSLSKQFTAAAIVKLEQDGRLTVGEPVGRFFPDAPPSIREVTLHELLTHTAGLPYLPKEFLEVKPRAAVLREMLHLPVDSGRVGSYFYSSPGYTILAGVVERASGQSYEEYLHEELFEPAGMTRTGFIGEARWLAEPRIHSYSGEVDEGPLQTFPEMPKALGAGSVISTVGDLYRWERVLRGGGGLAEAAIRKLFTRHVPVQGPVSHGYGWNIATTIRGTTVIVHAGDLGGYNSEYRHYADEDLVVILLSNRRVNGQGWRSAIMNNLSLLIAGADYSRPPAAALATPAALEPFTGTYALPGADRINVSAGDGVLMIGAEGARAAALTAGTDPALRAVADHLNRSAIAVARAFEIGRLDVVAEHLHPSLPAQDAREGVQAVLREGREQLGALRSVDVVATQATAPLLGRTALRFTFDRGERLVHLSWLAGQIAGIDTAAGIPLGTRFARTSPDRFAAFDAFTGRVVEVFFERGEDGDVVALRIGGVAAPLSPAAAVR